MFSYSCPGQYGLLVDRQLLNLTGGGEGLARCCSTMTEQATFCIIGRESKIVPHQYVKKLGSLNKFLCESQIL